MAGTTAKPTKIVIRSYQVGFGDCFLVSFEYARNLRIGTRHVLIDFGTTALPAATRGRKTLKQIAEQIARVTEGSLHAVVATHRHEDHIGGFQGLAGEIIAGLNPKVVVQPWTEDPKAARDAVKPSGRASGEGQHLRALAEMQAVAEAALREVKRRNSRDLRSDRNEPEMLAPGEPGSMASGVDIAAPEGIDIAAPDALGETRAFGKSVARQIAFLGEDNISNKAAVTKLMKMGRKHVYAYYGSKSGLEAILPGVKVHVLGPPTLEQSESIRTQREEDESEFWQFQALAGRQSATGSRLFPKAKTIRPGEALPIETRWFLPRLAKIRGEQLLAIVRSLDEAMNNTSLILLFQVGRRKLLFPGDAQIENWEYCLRLAPDRARKARLLEKVDFYKVGHHGSRNATPKTLWKLFSKTSEEEHPDRMKTLLSTKRGKHGSAARDTEVPRETLVDELESHTTFRTTETLTKKGDFCHEVIIDP